MAAVSLPAPGTEYGPCAEDCEHRDCKANREQAAQPCVHCPEPIGYERPFFQGDRGAAHSRCVAKLLDQGQEAEAVNFR